MKKVFALRAAAFTKNDPLDIAEKTLKMYDALLAQNGITESDCISLVFSVTEDIIAKNPATALRESNRAEHLALFCVKEAHFDGSPLGVIRALLHCYMEENAAPKNAYIDGAESLRRLKDKAQ